MYDDFKTVFAVIVLILMTKLVQKETRRWASFIGWVCVGALFPFTVLLLTKFVLRHIGG